MRFSIIIPVYNVEKYIRRCMNTVMNQTFRDFEVIVVDDETPDHSMQIVEEFAERYPEKIKMIHQKNTRQGGARNRGVREAQGEYLIFVDSDDYVSEKLLESVDRKLRETPCDILVFQNTLVTEDGALIGRSDFGSIHPGRYDPYQNKNILMLPCAPWGKAYLRSFYMESQMQFPEKLLYEDTMVRLLYAKAAEIVVCDENLYYYVQSANSSIRQKPSKRMLDILTVTDMVLDAYRKHGLYDHFQDVLESCLVGGIVYVLDIVNEAEPSNPLQDTMVDYIQKEFPDYKENPYLDLDVRKSMEILEKREFVPYHYRVICYRNLKRTLLRFKPIYVLNQFRRHFEKK